MKERDLFKRCLEILFLSKYASEFPKQHTIKTFALPPVVSGRSAYTMFREND